MDFFGHFQFDQTLNCRYMVFLAHKIIIFDHKLILRVPLFHEKYTRIHFLFLSLKLEFSFLNSHVPNV